MSHIINQKSSMFKLRKQFDFITSGPRSVGGLDSLKPRHLEDLILDELGTYSSNLVSDFDIYSLPNATYNFTASKY